jgi:hypothetical protein
MTNQRQVHTFGSVKTWHNTISQFALKRRWLPFLLKHLVMELRTGT